MARQSEARGDWHRSVSTFSRPGMASPCVDIVTTWRPWGRHHWLYLTITVIHRIIATVRPEKRAGVGGRGNPPSTTAHPPPCCLQPSWSWSGLCSKPWPTSGSCDVCAAASRRIRMRASTMCSGDTFLRSFHRRRAASSLDWTWRYYNSTGDGWPFVWRVNWTGENASAIFKTLDSQRLYDSIPQAGGSSYRNGRKKRLHKRKRRHDRQERHNRTQYESGSLHSTSRDPSSGAFTNHSRAPYGE